jgi:cytochrome c oxidase cbb3-type subunit III
MRFSETVSAGVVAVVLCGITAVHADKTNNKNDKQIAAGRDVFNRVCVSCHGKEGAGTPMARPLNQRGGTYGDTPEQIADVVRNGIKGTQMRSFKGDLKEQQIKAVAAYIASLRK